MKHSAKRGFSILLVFALCISLLSGLAVTADAAVVDYVKDGQYIYNWGERGVTATYLSPNGEDFYSDNGTSYTALSQLSGASSTSDVPNSSLYLNLKALMTNAQTTITSYDDTKELFKYTDCQLSGDWSNGKISSFYSGSPIGPNWDGGSTWNREHTWPDSKGNASGSGENDIMMLRPADKQENTSRGNKAYGESSSYYNPNSESNGAYDLRGDVARIMLYVYTRWGNTGSMWGSDGVIESKAVLLKWMEADPVDTWELGRNDAVESITGTRNVYVDYPELAFTLFDAEIPENYPSPSGAGSVSSYEINVGSNNENWGTVELNGSTINAFPKEGYYVADCLVLSGTAELTREGNTFTVNPSTGCYIQVQFAAKTNVTVKFSENGQTTSQVTVYAGDPMTLPNSTVTADGLRFVGWSTVEVADTADTPVYYTAGSQYTVPGEQTLYALYTRLDENGTGVPTSYEPYTGSLTEGYYILTADQSGLGAMTAAISSNRWTITDVTLTEGNIMDPDGSIVWRVEAAGNDSYTFYNESTGKYAAGTGAKNQGSLISTVTDYAKWTYDGDDFTNVGNKASGVNALLRRNGSYGFACYSSSTGATITLYKGVGGTLYYTTGGSTCQHSWGKWLEITAPGCTTGGEEARECALCGELESQAIAATGHSWSGEWVELEAPTCDKDGTNAQECANCSELLTEAIPATGHSWGQWIEITAPGCETQGDQARECANCNETDTQTIPATGHSYTDVVTPPTATEQGYTTHTCGLCGNSYTDAYVDALGQTYTVSFAVPEGVAAVAGMSCNNTGITLPTAGVPNDTYLFAGWTAAAVDDTTEAPDFYAAGETYIATENTTLYALYTYAVSDGTGAALSYQLVTEAPDSWEGEYVMTSTIASSGAVYVLLTDGTGPGTTSAAKVLADTGMSIEGSQLSSVTDSYVLVVEKVGSNYALRLKGASADTYLMTTNSNSGFNTATGTANANAQWMLSMDGSNVKIANASYSTRTIRFNASSKQFRTYTSGQNAIALYKKTGAAATIHYTTGGSQAPVIAEIKSASVTLESVLGVNFKVDAPDGYTVKIAVGDGAATEVALQDGVCTVSVYAEDMMQPITATLYDAQGVFADSEIFKLSDYAEKVPADAKALANATLTYCQYAAKVQGKYSESLNAPAAIPENAFADFGFPTSGPKGVSAYANLKEDCGLYLRLPDTYAEGYTFTVDGVDATLSNGSIGIDGILPQEYGTAHTFQIIQDETVVFQCEFSVLGYVGKCLNKGLGSADMQNLMTAMYHYYAAAAAYTAA